MMSNDFISRQAAIDICLQYCPDDDGTSSKNGDDLRNMLDEIEALPTVDANHIADDGKKVDAVQVVRCGECVYRRRCMLQHFVESNAVDSAKIDWSEWYCADGVRDISKSDERREKE